MFSYKKKKKSYIIYRTYVYTFGRCYKFTLNGGREGVGDEYYSVCTQSVYEIPIIQGIFVSSYFISTNTENL